MSYKIPVASTAAAGNIVVGTGLDITSDGVLSTTPGAPSGYYGEFYSTASQTNPVANTTNLITLNTTRLSNGVTLANGSQILFLTAGAYFIQLSFQMSKASASAASVEVWIRVNGVVDIPYSGRAFIVAGAGGSAVGFSTELIVVTPGDYIQIMWRGSSTGVTLAATPPNAIPGIPSVQITATQIGI